MPQAAAAGAQPTTLRDLLTEQATALGIPPDLALAMVAQESGGRQDATSPKGAQGLFQLMPETAAELGVDPADPIQNITGGLRYFKRQLDAHDGDVRLALAAYNAGPGAVAEAGGVVPDFPETQDYVARVLEGWRGGEPAPAAAEAPAAPLPAAIAGEPEPEPTHALGEDIRDVAESTLPVAGMMLGAAKGMAMGAPAGPPGIFLGGLAGAAVGGFSGEAVYQGLNFIGEKLGLVTPTEQTAEDVVRELAESANEGVMFEAFGQGLLGTLAPVARRLLKPLRARLTQYADDALREFPPNEGQAFLPSEVSESRALNIAENVADGSIFGGGRIAEVQAARVARAESKVAGTLERIAPRVPEARAASGAGQHALTSIDDAIASFRRIERPAWAKVRELADDIPLSQTPETTEFIARLTGQEAGALAPNAGVRAAQRVADLVGDTAIAELPESVQMAVRQALAAQGGTAAQLSAGQFTKTVSNLGQLVRGLRRAAARDPSKYNSQLGIAKKLLHTARADLESTLAAASPEALRAYERATLISRLGNQRLYNDAVLKVVGTSPARIADTLLRRNNSEAINLITKAVGRQNMQPLRRVALEKIMRPDAVTREINWQHVSRQLQSVGDDTLNALFPRGQAADLRRLSTLMNNLNRKPVSGVGRVGIMLTQWGAVAGVFSGTFTVPSGAILLGPWAMARIMASPAGARYLTRGIQTPLGSREGIRNAVYLTALLQQQMEETPEVRAQQDQAVTDAAVVPREDNLVPQP